MEIQNFQRENTDSFQTGSTLSQRALFIVCVLSCRYAMKETYWTAQVSTGTETSTERH